MATGATQTTVQAPATTAMDDPTTQGQVQDTASTHSNPETNLEEGQTATAQAPQEGRRGRSRDRAENVSRYAFEDLKVENAQPNDHNLTAGDPNYFRSLVASSLEIRNLPAVTTTAFHPDETAPLYPFATNHLRITSQDFEGEHGTALALELAIKLQTSHVAAKIRSEIISVATAGRTSDADLKRMRGLLFQLNNHYQLRSELGPYRDAVLKNRLDAGDLFPRESADDNLLTARRLEALRLAEPRLGERLRRYDERSDRRSSERSRAYQKFLRLGFMWNRRSRSRKRSRTRSRDAEARYDTRANRADANANGPSAMEEGRPPAPEGERDEESKERGPIAKFVKAIAAVLVLIVCFVPGLIYLGTKLALPNSEKTPRRQWHTTTKEAYSKQVHRLDYAREKGFPQRLVAALVGGLSLITPMLIMSLDPSLKKSLITTSVFILVFGFVLAWRTSMQAGEVLTATATYAAVLVVFTGVSN
ncbi:hypothetical protein CMUS01_09054 [Colletotrichum musicola]|uniref:DUF6594 domain-containing protein n=1 Tax=Colletotrichum musicola TaxID=2175873 RepID=A0A8H6NC90_9PEZI|nr:hypothetical protein CMUS01_09054 [Colletotrichum musicola]